ncbi:MAG TPA: hypothetical protein VHW05_03745 [Phenylobacterium sp.]|jgi:hypothetical protein|nr:hypothetical protein [Phenylobacterium sp.]
MLDQIPAQKFLVGQRVRVSDEARGKHFPDIGHWIAEACYCPDERQVLYSVCMTWPPTDWQDIQEGFYASDLALWAD